MKTKTLLSLVILSVIAFAGLHAQTTTGTIAASPTPNPNAGTYQDATLSIPQRLQLANAVISSGTDMGSIERAAGYMLWARPVVHLATLYPTFADSVIADPTLGGKLSQNRLWASAVCWKAATIASLDDRIAYLSGKVTSTVAPPEVPSLVDLTYRQAVTQKAVTQLAALDYAGAIATAASVLGFGDNQAIVVTFRAKRALRSPDVLNWAKLVYITSDFAHTQQGIDAVTSAYRSLNPDLVRANAFIQFQKDGVGSDPLAGVALPSVAFVGTDDRANALNRAIAGDDVGALKIAAAAFAAAPSGPKLNEATAFVAQWLRNLDGNPVRANAFGAAQINGSAYEIPELK